MPSGVAGGQSGFGSAGNTVVRIYVPAGAQISAPAPKTNALPAPTPIALAPGAPGAPLTAPTTTPAPVTQPPPSQSQAPGSQLLAINVSGPTTIAQTVSVGPNSGGCAPAPGGSTFWNAWSWRMVSP